MRDHVKPCLAFVGALVAVAGSLDAAVLINNDFSNATLTNNVADGVTIGAGTGAVGTLVTRIANANSMLVADPLNNGGRVIQFVDNSTTADGNNMRPVLGAIGNLSTASGVAISTTGTGNNRIQGSFSLTRLPVTLETGEAEGTFEFSLLTTSYAASTSTAVAAIRIKQGVLVYSGDTALEGTTTTFTMTPGTNYIFSIDVDLSSDVKDSWSFSVAAAGDPSTALFSSGTIDALANNVTPTSLIFKSGVNVAATSASPFMQLDDTHFEAIAAVPEPTMGAMALGGLGGLLALRRSHRTGLTTEQM